MELIWKLHSDPDNYIRRVGWGDTAHNVRTHGKVFFTLEILSSYHKNTLLPIVWNIKAKNSLEIKLKSGDMTWLQKSQTMKLNWWKLLEAAQLGLQRFRVWVVHRTTKLNTTGDCAISQDGQWQKGSNKSSPVEIN